MTSLESLEASVESSEPIEVYRLTYGSTTFRWTSNQVAVTVGLETFEPLAIERGAIVYNRERQLQPVEIRLPGEIDFPRFYLNVAPGRTATLSILRLQRNESPAFDTQVLLFKGTISSVVYEDDGQTAKLVARSIEFEKAQSVPRYTFQGVCNHFLYDSFCKVVASAFDLLGTPTAGGTTAVLTIPEAAGLPDGYFNGGYITPTSGAIFDFRMILDHTGDQITILLPFADEVNGEPVQLFAGCDHVLTGDCATKFDNVENFGGFHFVPNKNIFSNGL